MEMAFAAVGTRVKSEYQRALEPFSTRYCLNMASEKAEKTPPASHRINGSRVEEQGTATGQP